LSLTTGGRFNYANLELRDELGNNDDLNGEHTFKRFNPMAGLTYQFTPHLSAYGSYSEANARRRLRSSPAPILLLLAFWRFPGFRSGPQASGLPYLGGRVARQFRRPACPQQGGLEPRCVPYPEHE